MSALDSWLAGMFDQPPKDSAPFQRALTHGSQAADNYERLEFLGDRVLGLVTPHPPPAHPRPALFLF